MNIEKVEKTDYETLIDIWEASVRATHDFLQEEDIVTLKPLILAQYFDAVELMCARREDVPFIRDPLPSNFSLKTHL